MSTYFEMEGILNSCVHCPAQRGVNAWLHPASHQPLAHAVPSSHIASHHQQPGSAGITRSLASVGRESVVCRGKKGRGQWRPPSRGRPPSAPPATRRCTSSTSSPPTTASTTRPASAATTAREPSRYSTAYPTTLNQLSLQS